VKYRFEVVIRLKDGLLDPQGKAIEGALPHMGWTNVSDVRVGKHVELTIEADDASSAEEQARAISDRLLANPVIESVSQSYQLLDAGPDGSVAGLEGTVDLSYEVKGGP
jgi:phosphoribosylformylglycinamidine synthase subunit PurS